MEFKKYQHIERFGTSEVDGIDNGMCFIFPKLDGTNSQIWMDNNGRIRAGSRNRDLTLDHDNAGFYASVVFDSKLEKFFKENPNVRLYGEWLVPHTFTQYNDNAWRKLYVFDVEMNDRLIHYDIYSKLLDDYGIEYIPPICKIKNPSYDRLIELLEKATYCVKDGCGTGEGIVIKNYEYTNRYGRQTWAKIVRNEFKSKHQRCSVTEVKEKSMAEQVIVDKYITNSLVEKEYAKIALEGWSSRNIPQLLNTVYYSLVKEDAWNFAKEHGVVDFRRLKSLTFIKVKETMPHLF